MFVHEISELEHKTDQTTWITRQSDRSASNFILDFFHLCADKTVNPEIIVTFGQRKLPEAVAAQFN